MSSPLLSICIPAYNRPEKLEILLKTIDGNDPSGIEIVVCEDVSPRREEIRKVVEKFKVETNYSVIYHENKENLGFDGNLIQLVKSAGGEWIVFMGDDDEFIPGAIDKLIVFIKKHRDIVYVLRRYETVHGDGSVENFRYYFGNKFFEPGEKTYEEIFRKSVFISGFTIKRDLIIPHLIDEFDRFGLIQIYWVAELVLNNKSAYFDEPITRQVEDVDYRAKEMMYEEGTQKIVSRPVSLKQSLDFMSGYPKMAMFLDKKYKLNSFSLIMRDLSKYSYPILAIHRNKGIHIFLDYVKELNKLGYNITIYYYLYVVSLLFFGKKFCDFFIMSIKKILGKTPSL